MIIEKVEFDMTYNTTCKLFTEIKVGSCLCVGLDGGKGKCKYLVSYEEKNTYYLPIMKETIPIVSSVVCNRPSEKQLSLF